MTDIFIRVAEMSLTASAVIAVIIVLRLFLRKAPKIFSYVLWTAALFRLLCPISFELSAAPIPSIQIPYEAVNGASENIITPAASEQSVISELPAEHLRDSSDISPAPVSEATSKNRINFPAIASYIWAVSVFAMAFRGIASWSRLSRSLKSAQKAGENVYVSPAISDPFIMGLVRPKIYLPTGLSYTESNLIIRHERVHMRRGDHIAKLVMYVTLCIHCFNPLVWVMFRLFERDMEMSCDERVTADMTNEQKAEYSQTLLKISSKPAAVFTANFGESSTKQRIKNVLSFKKPAVWVIIVLTVIAAAVSIVLCANRKTGNTVTVPNVYASDCETAAELLRKEGFSVIEIPYSSTEPEGTVVRTKPEKSQKVPYGTGVAVFVSEGRINEIPIDNDDPDIVPTLGINGVIGNMRIEDYYGVYAYEDYYREYADEYEKYSEPVTDEEEIKRLRERFYPEYGDAVNECSFVYEYVLVPLYDESGKNVVDRFRMSVGDAFPVLPEGNEAFAPKEIISLIPLTEERQEAIDISAPAPEMLYADESRCIFTDEAGGLYLYDFDARKLLLAVDLSASMYIANSDIANEEDQYGGAMIYTADTENGKNIYFAFESKGKEKRGGEFNGAYYYLDVKNSELTFSDPTDMSLEAADTEQLDISEYPDALSSLLANINSRDYVYIANSGTEAGHLPMIRLVRSIGGTSDYFDPFENGLVPQEN